MKCLPLFCLAAIFLAAHVSATSSQVQQSVKDGAKKYLNEFAKHGTGDKKTPAHPAKPVKHERPTKKPKVQPRKPIDAVLPAASENEAAAELVDPVPVPAQTAATNTGGSNTDEETTGDSNDCEMVADFPIKDKCWKIFANITESKDLCDKTYGEIKDQEVSMDRFTGAECGCNTKSRGDGYNCYGVCTRSQREALKCSAGLECNMNVATGKTFCNCPYGSEKTETGNCRPIVSACTTCKHNCHMASTCINVKSDLDTLYSCGPCDHRLGYEGNGRSCMNIDECAANTHKCDIRATCFDKEPIYNHGKKYACKCQDGWTADKKAGTSCRPCRDNNECVEQPGICGPNADCQNTPGAYRCSCKVGYEKGIDNKCHDKNECLLPGICPVYSNCTNTEGSYECICIIGFKKVNGLCEPDPEYFCKDCDKATTECKLAPAKNAYTCECKKHHHRMDARSCAPNTFCDKAEKNNCAPVDRATCTDNPDGSGFNCTCKEGYEGDGRTCEAINICDRKRPCTFVSNTVCVADAKDPKNKYTCVCRENYVRQLAEQDNDQAPCYEKNSNVVNNCTLCDTNTEECKAVVGDKTGSLKSCVCKTGYAVGPNGKCGDKNECTPPEENNCDKECAVCINKIHHVDNMYFKCEVMKGWLGNGTIGTCKDDDECERKPCDGAHRVCRNTIGSFKCPCELGFREIPGLKDCHDDNECTRGNFTCNDFSFCNNTIGSYECLCQSGYKETGRDEHGKPICKDVDECKEGLNATGTIACPCNKTICHNTLGSFSCDCKAGYRKDPNGVCADINECSLRLDNCDVLSTVCNNTLGSFDCDCKHGYEKNVEKSNTTCYDIDECTSTTKPHKCNPNSSCKNLPGSYECKCDVNFEPEPDSHPMRPFCKRIDVCKTKKDLNCMCLCQNTEVAPFYRCKCQTGSINFNETQCITPGYCDTERNPAPEFPCPEHSVCKNERCICERSYDWVNVEEPLTVEKIKARKGCKPESWCEKYTCPPRAMCKDTAPGQGHCFCPEGFEMDETLGECIDINECYNKTLKCPSNSQCFNLVGSYKCECDDGYANTNTNKDTKLAQPVCDPIKFCQLKLDNCTSYPNTLCQETNPFYDCGCKQGYQRNQTRGNCGKAKGEQCAPMPCSDIDECSLKIAECDKNAKCINSPGSYKCRCNDGFYGNGKKCFDYNECELETDTCNRDSQDCINLPGTFNCTCKPGYEYGSDGKCKDINECLSATLNDCSKDVKLKCQNTPGSYYCECAKGYIKALNSSCIDDNECLFPSSCPQGKGDKCVNTEGDYNCTCQKGYKKSDDCDAESKTCPCADIPECKEGIVLADGNPAPACGGGADCHEQEGSYECKCKSGYEGDPFKKCSAIDLCTKFPCDEKTQRCIIAVGAPKCICKEGYVSAGNGKCIENPCLKKNGGCGKSAMCFPDPKTGEARCNCATGYILDDKKNCVAEDVCKCGEKAYPCRSDVCTDKDLQKCFKMGAKARCFCDKGYEFDDKSKKCKNIDECLDKPCPALANCTDTEGSFFCKCPRGQKYDGTNCVVDKGCSLEGYCREDPNASCEAVEKDRHYCVCKGGFKGTGRPEEAYCKPIDPCEEKQARENKKPCDGPNEYSDSTGATCVCKCDPGYERNTSTPFNCIDINECEKNLYTCKKTFECKNTLGGYECVCPKYHKLDAKKAECERDDKCNPSPCNNVTEHCDWRTGKCTCKDQFKLAPNGTCIDRNECEENTYKCVENSKCNNTYGSYDCVCFDGFEKKGDNCTDIDECLKDVCGDKVNICKNHPGSYECKCGEGFIQYGPRDCLKNSTDNCHKCDKHAHCLVGLTGIYNCTCNLGYEGDGVTKCTGINECELGIDNCHKLATCVDEDPLYSCHCNEPYEGDGRNVCDLPDMCTTKYNDCPKDADCQGLKEKDAAGKWVTCKCRNKGFEFNNKTRQCEDINECTRCKDYPNCPCPTEATCKNTEGSFTCECPKGYKYNPITNKCDDIDECVEGTYQEKCITGKGKCRNEPGTWKCDCEAGYKNKPDDNQICEKEIFCGIKDTCDKNTTVCVDQNVGFKCDCLEGLLQVPANEFKCEDRNECKDGSHNCSIDGSELCTNTYQSFACNCSNGFTRDEKTKKCQPDNKCSPADAEKANCGAYSFCVNLPGKDGKLGPKCICETGYYLAEKEQVCVVVPPCKNDFDCPSNSRCQVVQAQNKTGETGTYKCICNDGYETKGHQCFPAQPCKTDKICGEGVCVTKLLPPFYECACTPGTKQDNSTAPCMPLTCDSNVCTPHADCKVRQNGGIYCQCKPGFAGLGIISSPCKQIDLCASATPCSRYASCANAGSSYTCTCNEGYAGNGTWCSNINECEDPKLNNCDENAVCTDTQGSYKCTCKPGYTGVGMKGQCTNINECNDPALNQCDVISTICKDTEGGYDCICKVGYEKGNSTYACNEINECERNKTICGVLHTCHNIPGSWECICAPGYALVEGSEKKICADVDECKLAPPPCNHNAICKNTEGSFECTCKDGYIGDGIHNCTIKDLCASKTTNNCDPASTVCKMMSDKPAFVCECLPGYERQTGIFDQCADIDECNDESTPYDRESVACKNLPGSYELSCKDLYTAKDISADKKNITCIDKDECDQDPSFAETVRKAAAGDNKGTWKEWMVAPKDNTSGYAICYYNALNGINYNTFGLQTLDVKTTYLPMCVNLSPKIISPQATTEPKIRGFECTCAPPTTRNLTTIMKKVLYYCPAEGCAACRIDLNYECVNKTCVCKHGYSERNLNGLTQCVDRECGSGEAFPPKLIENKATINVDCDNNRFVAKTGYRLVRDPATQVVIDCVDIDECKEQPDICCANETKCTGPNCVKCFNTPPGKYTCQSDTIVCNVDSVDKNTCQCQGLACTKNTAWYADCSGNAPAIKGLDTAQRVCSRIFDQSINTYMSFDNEKAMYEYSVKNQCDCCFKAVQPEKFYDNPVFNYYGPCLDAGKEAEVKCPEGAKATSTEAGPWCPVRTKAGEFPDKQIGDNQGQGHANPDMCAPLPKPSAYLPGAGRMVPINI